MIVIKRVDATAEIYGIRALQEENLRKNVSEAEAAEQGFVTAEYSVEVLTRMHSFCPSVIAVCGSQVVGYVIAATKDIRQEHRLLGAFIDEIDSSLSYKGMPLKDCNYILCGQLCVSKQYRRAGITHKMYSFYKESLKDQFDYCITDVCDSNTPSLQAHSKVGFVELATVNHAGLNWVVVLWDWTGSNTKI